MIRRAVIREWLQAFGWWFDWRRFWGWAKEDAPVTVVISAKDYEDLGNELLNVSYGLHLTKQEATHLTRARIAQRLALAYTKINVLLERHPAFRHLEGFDSTYFDAREHEEVSERPTSSIQAHHPGRWHRTARS